MPSSISVFRIPSDETTPVFWYTQGFLPSVQLNKLCKHDLFQFREREKKIWNKTDSVLAFRNKISVWIFFYVSILFYVCESCFSSVSQYRTSLAPFLHCLDFLYSLEKDPLFSSTRVRFCNETEHDKPSLVTSFGSTSHYTSLSRLFCILRVFCIASKWLSSLPVHSH